MSTSTIPNFTNDGILPEGVFRCVLTDVENFFANIPDIIHRKQLYEKLHCYVSELNDSDILHKGILIDGSYVTSKINPSDIDIAVILDPNFVTCDCNQFNLKLIDAEYVKRFYGFSLFTVIDESSSLNSIIEFYQQQDPPNDNIPKGILRVMI